MLSKAPRAIGFALAVAVLPVLGCEPAVPANPTFAQDVGPIFAARCVRCHGETLSDGGDAARGPPQKCHLNHFDDTGDCSPAGVMALLCNRGAQSCAFDINDRIFDDPATRMPPPPSDPLSDWAREVVTRWASKPLP